MRLFCGDCLELMQDIPDSSVDMILCDLPYGTTACRWDSMIPFEPLWAHYKRILKPNGVVVLFAAQPFTTKLIQSNIRDFRYCWYWRKSNVTGGIFPRCSLCAALKMSRYSIGVSRHITRRVCVS